MDQSQVTKPQWSFGCWHGYSFSSTRFWVRDRPIDHHGGWGMDKSTLQGIHMSHKDAVPLEIFDYIMTSIPMTLLL
ncbi:hypothetical protein L484_023599 [Morus notabilis]|uniref:Uncharacterized protein n=1 Tax=Morus notabilis TaxID=981085 RepID=W9RPJ0_9ROSA|nr:hypothetical protein L484_023599 [Morus notabilis]